MCVSFPDRWFTVALFFQKMCIMMFPKSTMCFCHRVAAIYY